MRATAIDALTSQTLKHLRERWWNDDFTGFLVERLRPRAGNRILDVGCGEGLAEINIGRRQISQIRLVGLDHVHRSVVAAKKKAAAHNQRVSWATADAVRLPFRDASFDAIFCVAVLQHVHDVEAAIGEFARLTTKGGRVLAVEPDNTARYGYSSVTTGQVAFEMAARFFAAVAHARGERGQQALGPSLPGIFARHGVEPLEVKLFPVSQTTLGPVRDVIWAERRASVNRCLEQAPTEEVLALGAELLNVLEQYRIEAKAAGSAFVEIQNTMLFSTLGQRAG